MSSDSSYRWLVEEVNPWAAERQLLFVADWYIEFPDRDHLCFHFRKPEDAMIFKLMWGGK